MLCGRNRNIDGCQFACRNARKFWRYDMGTSSGGCGSNSQICVPQICCAVSEEAPSFGQTAGAKVYTGTEDTLTGIAVCCIRAGGIYTGKNIQILGGRNYTCCNGKLIRAPANL